MFIKKAAALILFMITIMVSCKKPKEDEGSTRADVYIRNNSTHNIEIRPYNGGDVYQDRIIQLSPGGLKTISGLFKSGKQLIGSGDVSDYFATADSVVVVFDGSYRITHYKNTPASPALKHYIFSSTRNLYNYHSYESTIMEETETFIHYQFIYKFNDQDYLDAKN